MPFIFLLILIFFLLLLFALKGKDFFKLFTGKNSDDTGAFCPYLKNQVLFSPAERSLLGVLYQAFASDYQIFAKVRVADVVSVKKMPCKGEWQRAFNRINAKHFDFVLCSKTDLSIIAVLELNDLSHEDPKRRERDEFLSELCSAIALPFIPVKAECLYSVGELKTAVAEAIEKNKTVLPPVDPANSTELSADAPKCPNCMAPMILRTARSGVNKGQEFWGCSQYPKCRTLIPKKS